MCKVFRDEIERLEFYNRNFSDELFIRYEGFCWLARGVGWTLFGKTLECAHARMGKKSSLGDMDAQLGAFLKPLGTIVLCWSIVFMGGGDGGPSINAP